MLKGGRPGPKIALRAGMDALPAGKIGYRSGPTMAAADEWVLTLKGAQTHGSHPWDGIDPLTVATQVQLAMQSIVARQVDIVRSPVVLTTCAIQGGVRDNIIPEQLTMTGTLCSFDEEVRADVIKRIERTAARIARASGASAEFAINVTAPLTRNQAALASIASRAPEAVAARHGGPHVQAHRSRWRRSAGAHPLAVSGALCLLIYVLAGHPTLYTDAGPTQPGPGMCAGSGDGHRLVNESDELVEYLEIGDRTAGDQRSTPTTTSPRRWSMAAGCSRTRMGAPTDRGQDQPPRATLALRGDHEVRNPGMDGSGDHGSEAMRDRAALPVPAAIRLDATEVATVDPLAVFAAAGGAPRFYWEQPAQGRFRVAIGALERVRLQGPDRFARAAMAAGGALSPDRWAGPARR